MTVQVHGGVGSRGSGQVNLDAAVAKSQSQSDGVKSEKVLADSSAALNEIVTNRNLLDTRPEHRIGGADLAAQEGLDRLIVASTVEEIEGSEGLLNRTLDPIVTETYDALVDFSVSELSQEAGMFGFASGNGFEVMLKLGVTMNALYRNERELSGTLIEKASKSMESAVNLERKLGSTQMTQAIGGAVLQGLVATIGTYVQAKGLKQQMKAIDGLETRADLKSRLAQLKQVNQQSSKNALAGSKPDDGGASALTRSRAGSAPVVGLDKDTSGPTSVKKDFAGNMNKKPTSSEQQNVNGSETQKLPSQEESDLKRMIKQQKNDYDRQSNAAALTGAKGKLLDPMSHGVQSLYRGPLDSVQADYRASQKTAEFDQHTANGAVTMHAEGASRNHDAVQKAIEAAKNILSNTSSVAGQVAGNLRA